MCAILHFLLIKLHNFSESCESMEDIADLSDEAIEEVLLKMISLEPTKFFRTQKSKKRRRRLKEDLCSSEWGRLLLSDDTMH